MHVAEQIEGGGDPRFMPQVGFVVEAIIVGGLSSIQMNHLQIGRDYTLQKSGDLTNWQEVASFTASAGTWLNTGGNSNIVPVVANGKVFVASNKELRIFGLH